MKKKKFNLGDTVRKNRASNIFEKGNHLWSSELFKMSKIPDNTPMTYRLCDMKDDKILGVFSSMNCKKLKQQNLSD